MIKILLKGVIVPDDDAWIYDLFGISNFSPSVMKSALKKAMGQDVEVDINSGGGDVYSGSEIYTDLMAYQNKVATNIVAIAASAAGVVAMAGRPARISPTAQIMIHNVTEVAYGDYRYFEHEAGVLKNYNKSIANAYRLKSSLPENELLELMNKETWLNAQQAKEMGFVDEIMFDTEKKLAASAGQSVLLPREVINKMRNMKPELMPDENGKNKDDIEKAKMRLNLLKLKGGFVNEIPGLH